MANLKNNAEILGLRSNVSNEIAKKLSSIRDRDYYSVLGDFFEASAISVKNAVDRNDREHYEKRFSDIAKSKKGRSTDKRKFYSCCDTSKKTYCGQVRTAFTFLTENY